jgi:uracil-DNA glycosylase
MQQYKMAIVGEAWNKDEAEAGRPFVGANGKTLDLLLATVGIRRDEVLLTSVFAMRPSESSNDISLFCGPKVGAVANLPALVAGKYVRAEFQVELDRLYTELTEASPNVVVTMGSAALWALAGTTGLKKARGAPLISLGPAARTLPALKLLPTYPPSSVNREWKLRPIVMADLAKAKREAEFPEIRRPRREFWLHPTIDDLHEFEARFISGGAPLSTDIETASGQVTCIGFAPSPDIALVVPFTDAMQPDGNYWRTLREEKQAWRFVKRLCETHPHIGQNFLYDSNYLWKVYGIRCFGMEDDTMLLHHALQPEMEKGLGFLGSVYTNEPAWKFMRAKHETLKKED